MFLPIPKLRRAIFRFFTAALVLAILSVLALPPAMAAEASTVRVKDGHIQEYVNGSLRRSYGSDIVDVSTDGEIVAAVTKQGHIQEYANGSLHRSYGSDVVRVRVSGGSVFADLKNGHTIEYVNGSRRRTF